MKSTLMWAVAAVVAGLAGGAAVGYWEARPWTADAVADGLRPSGRGDDHDRDAAAHALLEPRADVPETTFHFGNMESGTTQRHTFPVRNQGGRPLKLTFVSHTCKCTEVLLDGKKVEPGASATVEPHGASEVQLEWAAKVPPGPFRHGASFTTNDDRLSRLEFSVEGEIVESTTLAPSQLYFGSVHVQQPGAASLFAMAFLEPEVKILSYEVLDAELAKRIQIAIEPVGVADLPNAKAKAGVKVTATYQSDGTLGPFVGSLRMKTNLRQAPTLEVPISGRVQGDISIFGSGWTEENGLLRMAPATSAAGGVSRLNINIRGEHAAATELSVESVDPPVLNVALGERTVVRAGLVRVPLTVEIPPGTRPMVRAGEDQGGVGEIVLATTHPVTPKVRLRVTFTVQP